MPRQDAATAAGVERFFQFSLLGMVASGYLAVAATGFLDLPTIVVTAAGLLLRALLVLGVVRLQIPPRLSAFLTIAYTLFFAADYYLLSRDLLMATVHLLFFVAVLKILTAVSDRDHHYTAVIAFLELLSAAILSTSFHFFLFLALFLLLAIAALASGEIRRSLARSPVTARGAGQRIHLRLAVLVAGTTVAILAGTAGLFFLLPRTAEAAFARLASRRVFLPGFSNQVNLGDIGELKTSSVPVMHIRIWSATPVAPMKWRGMALADFDGKRWTNIAHPPEGIRVEASHAVLSPPGLRLPGRRLNYHVELEALENDTLFFAGTPEILDLSAPLLYRSDGDGWRLGRPAPRGFQYDAWSLLDEVPERASARTPPPVLPLAARERFLQLPPLDSRIAALAQSFSAGAATDLERARAIERHLRHDYSYTLELPRQEAADPLAQFLFTRRKGHCEYFASSMAVMLRSVGIPARLATGFQSGIFNPVSGLWLVRAGDAHSWVEAWMPGTGWATFDPTPPDPNAGGTQVFTRLALYLDATETFWREWVMAYDITHQGALAYRVELGARHAGVSWFDATASLREVWNRHGAGWARRFGWRPAGWAVLLLALALAARPLAGLLRIRRGVERVRRGEASVADATLLYQRMLHLLHRRGYQKPPWFTPAEFAASLPPSPLGEAVAEFTGTYNALRFGRHAEAAVRLTVLLDRMERQ